MTTFDAADDDVTVDLGPDGRRTVRHRHRADTPPIRLRSRSGFLVVACPDPFVFVEINPDEATDPTGLAGRQRLWKSRDYVVTMHESDQAGLWLSIRDLDSTTAVHDWRVLQSIKNALAGPEWEAVELYPAESRLVDQANQYHLWCFPEQLPFGFQERVVMTAKENDRAQALLDTGLSGRQRPFSAATEAQMRDDTTILELFGVSNDDDPDAS